MIRSLWARLVAWGWDYSYELTEDTSKPVRISRSSISVSFDDCDIAESDPSITLHDPIRFRVQQVSGGTVVETKWYDPKKDEDRVRLHIITPEENLSESIGKIVTMELLQK
jgi:hypothetical protein